MELLKIPIDMNELLSFIIQIDRSNTMLHPRDLAEDFMERFIGFLNTNSYQFNSEKNSSTGGNYIGKLFRNDKGVIIEVAILTGSFEEKVREFNFEDSGVILNALKNKGWLCHDKDHNSQKVVISPGMGNPRCYVIKIPIEKSKLISESSSIGDNFNGFDNIE